MSFQPKYQEINIVVRGDFAPAMFHPSWFSKYNLLKASEVEAAKGVIIADAVARFSVDWLFVEILTDRLLIRTDQEAFFEPLRDLGIGIFTLLEATPCRVMGINSTYVYDMFSEEAWHSLGHILAPKEKWNNLVKLPGMLNLIMECGRPDSWAGHVHVKIQPNRQIADFGALIEINDHYDLRGENTPQGTEAVLEILTNKWADSTERSLEIAQGIRHFGVD